MLGVGDVDDQIHEVEAGLSCVLLQPETALREYAAMTLHSKRLSHALLDNRYSKSFLAAIPGLYPWAMLGKAWYHAIEERAGQQRFDSVIIDAPATGHGLEMLRVPLVISEAAAPGILRRDAERAWSMLSDPSWAGIVVVSLPEQLPLSESIELIAGLKEMGLSPQRVVLNARLQRLFDDGELDEIRNLVASEPSLPTSSRQVIDVAMRRAGAEVEQQRVEQQVRELGYPVSVLPFVKTAGSPSGIDVLAAALASS